MVGKELGRYLKQGAVYSRARNQGVLLGAPLVQVQPAHILQPLLTG